MPVCLIAKLLAVSFYMFSVKNTKHTNMTALSVATTVAVYLCLGLSVHGRFEEIVQENGRCTKSVNCTDKYDREACCDKAQCCRLKTQADPLSYCYYCADISFCCPVKTCCYKRTDNTLLYTGNALVILATILAFGSCLRYWSVRHLNPEPDHRRFQLAALRAAMSQSEVVGTDKK